MNGQALGATLQYSVDGSDWRHTQTQGVSKSAAVAAGSGRCKY